MRRVRQGKPANRDEHQRCRKVPFESKAKARKKLKGPYISQAAPKAVYWCHECRAWHLSSRRDR